MPNDAPTVDYRRLLEEEGEQLRAQLAELGVGEGAGGLAFDPNLADSSQVTAERGELETLVTQLRESLDEVAHALEKLSEGNYGHCEVCDKPIAEARLEAMPATRFCIEHASRH